MPASSGLVFRGRDVSLRQLQIMKKSEGGWLGVSGTARVVKSVPGEATKKWHGTPQCRRAQIIRSHLAARGPRRQLDVALIGDFRGRMVMAHLTKVSATLLIWTIGQQKCRIEDSTRHQRHYSKYTPKQRCAQVLIKVKIKGAGEIYRLKSSLVRLTRPVN
jgi:hypothetical protein